MQEKGSIFPVLLLVACGAVAQAGTVPNSTHLGFAAQHTGLNSPIVTTLRKITIGHHGGITSRPSSPTSSTLESGDESAGLVTSSRISLLAVFALPELRQSGASNSPTSPNGRTPGKASSGANAGQTGNTGSPMPTLKTASPMPKSAAPKPGKASPTLGRTPNPGTNPLTPPSTNPPPGQNTNPALPPNTTPPLTPIPPATSSPQQRSVGGIGDTR
jgi:hypothetical protein